MANTGTFLPQLLLTIRFVVNLSKLKPDTQLLLTLVD